MPPVTSLEELDALYGPPLEVAVRKVTDRLTPHYRAFVEASPFVVLATVGPDGMDASPRGDAPGHVRVLDDRTLLLADRPGNKRVDSLRNVVRDPRVGLLFLLPGHGLTLRVSGTAVVTTDEALRQSFADARGRVPKTVVVVTTTRVYVHCPRALDQADIWQTRVPVDAVASLPEILAALETDAT